MTARDILTGGNKISMETMAEAYEFFRRLWADIRAQVIVTNARLLTLEFFRELLPKLLFEFG